MSAGKWAVGILAVVGLVGVFTNGFGVIENGQVVGMAITAIAMAIALFMRSNGDW